MTWSLTDAGAAPTAALLTAAGPPAAAAGGSSAPPTRNARDLSYRSEAGAPPDPQADATRAARTATRRLPNWSAERGSHKDDSDHVMERQRGDRARLRSDSAVFADASGRSKDDPAGRDRPRLPAERHVGLRASCAFYLAQAQGTAGRRAARGQHRGGLFPAIFGTVMLVFTHEPVLLPAGVIAGDLPARIRRATASGPAGAHRRQQPGGHPVDRLRHLRPRLLRLRRRRRHRPAVLPRTAARRPTFGTGGILWASLTLALLTVPVVIVATEEALRRDPARHPRRLAGPRRHQVPDADAACCCRWPRRGS